MRVNKYYSGPTILTIAVGLAIVFFIGAYVGSITAPTKVVTISEGIRIDKEDFVNDTCPEDAGIFWGGEGHTECITLDDIQNVPNLIPELDCIIYEKGC